MQIIMTESLAWWGYNLGGGGCVGGVGGGRGVDLGPWIKGIVL